MIWVRTCVADFRGIQFVPPGIRTGVATAEAQASADDAALNRAEGSPDKRVKAAETPHNSNIPLEHFLTHEPKRADCPACQEAKAQASQHRRKNPAG